MQHAITWGSLFGVGFTVAGIVLGGVGALAIFAGGMSDAPAEGESTASMGCLFGAGGVVLAAIGVWMLV
jgi:hypothetical protein